MNDLTDNEPLAALAATLRVPVALRERFCEIATLTDSVCERHLDEELCALARQMTAALARKRPSPLTRGKAQSWAGAVIYALARINFLFYDGSCGCQISADQIGEELGIASSTAANKASQLIKLLGTGQFDTTYMHSRLSVRDTLEMMSGLSAMLARREASASAQPFPVRHAADGRALLCLSALMHSAMAPNSAEAAAVLDVSQDSFALQGELDRLVLEVIDGATISPVLAANVEKMNEYMCRENAQSFAAHLALGTDALMLDCSSDGPAMLAGADGPLGFAGALLWRNGDGVSLMAFGGDPERPELLDYCLPRPYLTFGVEREPRRGELVCAEPSTWEFHRHPSDSSDEHIAQRLELALELGEAALIAAWPAICELARVMQGEDTNTPD